jgi:hypothetical protein
MNICLPYVGTIRSLRTIALAAALSLAAAASADTAHRPAAGLGMGAVFAASQSATATEVPVNPEHPDRYVVVRGDTLWDIAGLFLQDPWYWPEIWHVNEQIDNPHLIYPGDVLTLVYVDGQPQIRLERGARADRTIQRGIGDERLSPRIRVEELDSAINTIAAQDIAIFFSRGTVLEKSAAKKLPYVVALRGHLVAGAGHEVFIRNMSGQVGAQYNVVRMGERLVDPDDGDVVGYQGIFIGEGTLTATGNPATIFLNETVREAYEGDLIMPVNQNFPLNFFPRPPARQVSGQIISVIDGVSRIGQYQTVVLNRGSRDGLEAGSVLQVWAASEKVGGHYSMTMGKNTKKVRLPPELVGTLMVVRPYDRISYALIMEATSEILVLYSVSNPI